MQVTRANLKTALTAIDLKCHRSKIPALQKVRLQPRADGLTLSHTDAETYVSVTLPGSGNGLLPTYVQYTDLKDAVKAGPETIDIESADDNLQIVGRATRSIPAYTPESYPTTPSLDYAESITIDVEEFVAAAKGCLAAMAKETMRYAVNGALLESDAHGTALVATDGRRLCVYEITDNGNWSGKIILSRNMLDKAVKLSKGQTTMTIAINLDNDLIRMSGDNWSVTSRAVDGKFPDYRDIIPERHNQYKANRQALLDALDCALPVAKDCRACKLNLDFTEQNIRLHTSCNGNVFEHDLRANPMAGKRATIATAINCKYMIDAVKHIDADDLIIDLQPGGQRPIAISDSTRNSLWVTMPVELK